MEQVATKRRVTIEGTTYVVRSNEVEIPDLSAMPRVSVLQWLVKNAYIDMAATKR